jgi:hypothetical protein
VVVLTIIWAFSALLPLLAEGFSGPAAGYSGLRNPGCPGLFVCSTKPSTHVQRQSHSREPGCVAAVSALYERIESIGFSLWPLAIRAGRVPQLTEDFKRKVVTNAVSRKILILFCCQTSNLFSPVRILTRKQGAEPSRQVLPFNLVRSRRSAVAAH